MEAVMVTDPTIKFPDLTLVFTAEVAEEVIPDTQTTGLI
jgi:hypothetical protein